MMEHFGVLPTDKGSAYKLFRIFIVGAEVGKQPLERSAFARQERAFPQAIVVKKWSMKRWGSLSRPWGTGESIVTSQFSKFP